MVVLAVGMAGLVVALLAYNALWPAAQALAPKLPVEATGPTQAKEKLQTTDMSAYEDYVTEPGYELGQEGSVAFPQSNLQPRTTMSDPRDIQSSSNWHRKNLQAPSTSAHRTAKEYKRWRWLSLRGQSEEISRKHRVST